MTSPGDLDDLGERLAAWLERLGLVEHLGAAGLPRLERDVDGRAVWRDPTGHPLSREELVALDDLLHHQGSEPEHAVPVALVQVARQARVRQELLASPTHTYESLAAVRGASVEATRFAVHKAASTHRLLVVAADELTLVPGFQLTGDGEVRADLAPVLEPLLAARMDPWRVWAWLTRPRPSSAVWSPSRRRVIRRTPTWCSRRPSGWPSGCDAVEPGTPRHSSPVPTVRAG